MRKHRLGSEKRAIALTTFNSFFRWKHRDDLRKPSLVRSAQFGFFLFNSHLRKGGIAQLVERQLCKLDVKGSNPFASTNW